jgi:flagellin-like hook-associated protein FlgL
MSGIVLSASVRQNLLSLQSTADLLSTTQSRLSTGKKVNSALDNPTNFFTAQGLDHRSSDINNLLDGIGNGVQVLQAANTGITSLQKLVDSAKSVANQALQAPVGYSQKSTFTSNAIAGATAADLRGNPTNASLVGSVVNNNLGTPAAITAATKLVAAATSDTLAATPTGVLTVNGKTITFDNTKTTSTTDGNGNVTLGTGAGSTLAVSDLLSAIDGITGAATASTVAAGKLTISTGATQDLTISGTLTSLSAFGLTAGTTTRTPGPLSGLTLTIGATGSNGVASNITFGDGSNGTVKTLNDLNAKLSSNNLLASIDSTGVLSISTTNDAASSTIGTIGGTSVGASKLFAASIAASAPVKDVAAQTIRSNLVAQYNNILDQITSTAQDASYNGVNLLNGDQLKLTFNETGKSTLNIQGVQFNATGLGLSKLAAGTDFSDNSTATSAIKTLGDASTALRTQASTLGSNLSVVQIRQDFSKNLINVLQTGSSNLTLADTNEEAANSQALSTRQSIAVSALSLANQSQQSVLQLLR